VKGSTIVDTNDVALTAAHDVNITTSQDTMQSSGRYQETSTGLGTSGLTVTIGTNQLATTIEAAAGKDYDIFMDGTQRQCWIAARQIDGHGMDDPVALKAAPKCSDLAPAVQSD
jgi:hypothetical protein